MHMLFFSVDAGSEFISEARDLCFEIPEATIIGNYSDVFTVYGDCGSGIIVAIAGTLEYNTLYDVTVKMSMPLDGGRIVITDVIVVYMKFPYDTTTTEYPTTTPCQNLERLQVGLNKECGNHSSTGYCTVQQSACVNQQNDTWKCNCISGYVENRNRTSCVEGIMKYNCFNLINIEHFENEKLSIVAFHIILLN